MRKLLLSVLVLILLAACSKTVLPAAKEKDIDASQSSSSSSGESLIQVIIAEIAANMVSLSGGVFKMGSPIGEENRSPNENYRTANDGDVTLNPFKISKYPVTQEQYFAVMGTNPSSFKTPVAPEINTNKRPVEQVNWYHAIAFCNRLSILASLTPVYTVAGKSNVDAGVWLHSAVPTDWETTWNAVTVDWTASGYRLPTEAEWEYSCRAGTTTRYWSGNDETSLLGKANVRDLTWIDALINEGEDISFFVFVNIRDGHIFTSPVGSFSANAWGLYDMHGNVYEWCWDWYTDSFDDAGGSVNPIGPASPGSRRVIRGGSWDVNGWSLRSAFRLAYDPADRFSYIGFRVVRSVPNETINCWTS